MGSGGCRTRVRMAGCPSRIPVRRGVKVGSRAGQTQCCHPGHPSLSPRWWGGGGHHPLPSALAQPVWKTMLPTHVWGRLLRQPNDQNWNSLLPTIWAPLGVLVGHIPAPWRSIPENGCLL